MRRIWRLLRVLGIALTHTPYASLAARFRPPEVRHVFRALRQMIGSRALCRCLGVRVSVSGTLPRKPALLVCNHLGILDPLVLGSQMPVAFAGKAEMRRWPLVGWICRTMGMLFVERERPTRASVFVRQVQEKLSAGVSVLVFPEGTTSTGDEIRPFKTGAFEAVAHMREGTVLPLHLSVVEIDGAPAGDRRREVAWAGEKQSFVEHAWHLFGLGQVHMLVRVGEPLSTEGRDRKELARLSYRRVVALAGHVMEKGEDAAQTT